MEFDPLTGDPLPKSAPEFILDAKKQNGRISDLELSQLDSLPKEALISLIQRISAARWGEILLLSPEATYQAIIDKSAYMALTTDDVNAFVKASTQYMERTKGKVADRVEQTTQITGSIAMISKEEVKNIINSWISGNINQIEIAQN